MAAVSRGDIAVSDRKVLAAGDIATPITTKGSAPHAFDKVLVPINVTASKLGLVGREDNEITAKTSQDRLAAAQRLPVPVVATTGDDQPGNAGQSSFVPSGQK